MAAIGVDFVTLHDWAARFGAKGEYTMQTVIELQAQTNIRIV